MALEMIKNFGGCLPPSAGRPICASVLSARTAPTPCGYFNPTQTMHTKHIPPSRLHRKPPCELSRRRRRAKLLKRSADFIARGLTWKGQPRKYRRRYDLGDLRGNWKDYRKEWNRLNRQRSHL